MSTVAVAAERFLRGEAAPGCGPEALIAPPSAGTSSAETAEQHRQQRTRETAGRIADLSRSLVGFSAEQLGEAGRRPAVAIVGASCQICGPTFIRWPASGVGAPVSGVATIAARSPSVGMRGFTAPRFSALKQLG